MALPPDLQALAAEVSNWGRWGDDDEIGTLNLIDDAAVARGPGRRPHRRPVLAGHPARRQRPAARHHPRSDQPAPHDGGDQHALHRRRRRLLLQRRHHHDGPAGVHPLGRASPTSATPGCSTTGSRPRSTTAERGATRCGIHKVGTDREPGDPARRGSGTGSRRAAARATRSARPTSRRRWSRRACALEPGDIVLVRTGQMTLLKRRDREGYTLGDQPGLTTHTIRWLRRHDVAAVATDTLAMEVFPCEDPAVLFPVHMIQLRDMGLTQGQNFDLEALAAHCAQRRRLRDAARRQPRAGHRRHRCPRPSRRHHLRTPPVVTAPASFNFADVWEMAADAVPEREALVCRPAPPHLRRSSRSAPTGWPTTSGAAGWARATTSPSTWRTARSTSRR